MGNISSAKAIGSTATVDQDIQAFFLAGSSPEQLEQDLNALDIGVDRNIIDLSLGGGGKGNIFMLTVTTGPTGTGPDELYWALFGASSEPELESAAVAALARILAQPGVPADTGLLGQTVVGSAHGAQFCGLLLTGASR